MAGHYTIVVLSLIPLVSHGEVSSFTKCDQFFYRGVSSTILNDSTNNNRYQQLCQCLLDQNSKPKYYFATLYDTVNKIPVYSAYELQSALVDRTDRWYIEPQLDGGTHICMGGLNNVPSNNRGEHQALSKDYEGSGYDKGHLYPVSHTATQEAMLATSTLTNAAPQDPGFNRGQWRTHEEGLAGKLTERCAGSYVVTGVVPDVGEIGSGVRVARFYWSAYCCLMGDGSTESAGFIGPDNNGRVETVEVKALEGRLGQASYYGSAFSVFGGNC